MISCLLFGGLGNNLFQLATTLNLHKTYGFDYRIPSRADRGNISIYGQSTELEFKELFDNVFLYDDEINKKLNRYVHPDYNLGATDYSYTPIPYSDNTTYVGYFQSEKYFENLNPKEDLILSKKNTDIILNKYSKFFDKKNISLHYRLGGDRTTSHMQHYHKDVSIDYYKTALEDIIGFNQDEYNILVFTDNIDKAKYNLKDLNYPFYFVDNSNNNILDFIFMSMCDINIVGNSTFSWWAAYLNQTENNKVIVTENEWFGPGYKHFNLKDTFPESWIRI
jgi:hypothetical protein